MRSPGAYNEWRGRKGLSCLLCRNPVEVYHIQSTRNTYVRHGKDSPPGMIRAGGKVSESFEHARLKQWTRDRLADHGLADAVVEPHIGDQYPDVYGTKDGTTYAVEIQWSNLDHETARRRTDGLRAAGCDHVLWVTRHRHWIEKIPAVSLGEFRQSAASAGYRIRSGFLTAQSPPPPRRPTMSSQHYPLDGFLRQWTSQDALAWAYITPTIAGWATVTDWETFTKGQAAEIAKKKRQLASALAERDDLKHQVDESQTAIASNIETITQQANAIDRAVEEQKNLKQQIDDLSTDLNAAQEGHAAEYQRRRDAEQKLPQLIAEVRRLQVGITWRKYAIIVLLVVCGVLALALLLA
ncbi:hypothetical protein [Nocardia sp. NPDC002869]|uniref:competence protein CoiA family protein n=1 Tax=Nocardia sp. NPDC002869 TaxID=3161032 RepID=UPI00398CA259